MNLLRANNPYQVLTFISSILFFIFPLAYFQYQGSFFVFRLTGAISSKGLASPLQLSNSYLVVIVVIIVLLALLPLLFSFVDCIKLKINNLNVFMNIIFILLVYFLYIQKIEYIQAEIKDGTMPVLLPLINITLLYFSNRKIRNIDLEC